MTYARMFFAIEQTSRPFARGEVRIDGVPERREAQRVGSLMRQDGASCDVLMSYSG